jgi:ATP-dependent protease ClpP protease subunit
MDLKTTTSADGRPVLWVHNVIGTMFGGIGPDDVRQALSDIPDNQAIDVRIHSDGGSFPDSIAIYSMLTRRKGATHVIVDGKAYSGGSVIAQAGKTIRMTLGSWMMIHEARGKMEGTAGEYRAAADRLDAVNDQLVQIYKPRWKGSEKELRAALNAETWMSDINAVDRGLADSVDTQMAVAAYVDPERFGYRNVPDAILQANRFPRLEWAAGVMETLNAA